MINSNTKITLGLAAAAISTLVGTGVALTWQASRMVATFEERNAATDKRTVALEDRTASLQKATEGLATQLTTLTTKLAALSDDQFPLSRASEQSLREAIENPGHRVPDPRDPTKIIVVSSHRDPDNSKGTAR